MASEHPFQTLFQTLGRLPIAHADTVNRQAYEILYDVLSVPVEKPGRCILLRAPRAGHGKTHLLSRIQHHLGASHEFIPLHASFGCQIDAATVIDDSLRRLLRPLPASGGLTVLDLVSRRLFATALQPLVGSGEVPCQDREGALTALRTRPIETFDFHHPNAVTAHWARENFEVLGQRLSVELSQRCDLPAREVAFWIDALFRFAATPVDNPVRLRTLADAIHAGNPGERVLMERLEALLGLLAQLMRVVLVADDLEGFSTDESAALRLAAFLGALRQSVERLDVILSLNQDIWQSAFLPRLSGGLADRLSEVVVELDPLTEDEMVALLESRVPGLGARVLSRVDRGVAGTHARGLIRAAGMAWLRATAMDSQWAAAPMDLPAASAAVLPEPEVSKALIGEPLSLGTISESSPVLFSTEPAPAEAHAASFVPAVHPEPERTPDPTPAIAFLAATANEPTAPEPRWPAPEFTSRLPAGDVPDSPFEAATPAPIVESEPFSPAIVPAFPPETSDSDASVETTAPVRSASEPPAWNPPVDSPFQVAPAAETSVFSAETADSEPNTDYGSPSVEAFEPASEAVSASPFQVAPESCPAPVLQLAPENPVVPVSQSSMGSAQTAVPDTDRVDDLLRQFRERYGRGSM